MKCNVTRCQNRNAVCWHTERKAAYCPKCARGINEFAPGLVLFPTDVLPAEKYPTVGDVHRYLAEKKGDEENWTWEAWQGEYRGEKVWGVRSPVEGVYVVLHEDGEFYLWEGMSGEYEDGDWVKEPDSVTAFTREDALKSARAQADMPGRRVFLGIKVGDKIIPVEEIK